MYERRLFQGGLTMRNFEEIFNGLPEYVGTTWWQEQFAKKFKGTMKGSYHDISAAVLRTLAEEMKDGLERASLEASEFISTANVKGDITRYFKICSDLASELCPRIDIAILSLIYYQGINKWAVEIIGVNSELGYQCSHALICVKENDVIRDFLASDEFIVASMHLLFDCDEQIAECERDVSRW